MPVFMIGTQRSGSNLLRLMLNQSPQLAAPHPPHILERLKPLLARYGDLRDRRRFAVLVDDVCRLIDTNPVAWSKSAFDRDRVLSRCKDPSLLGVMEAVYAQQACDADARDWLCKSMVNVHFVDEIAEYFGDRAKFIYLHRDGRDVALSFQRAIVGEKHVYSIAREWHRDQQKALAHCRRAATSVFRISYEDLTAEPRPVLERLCDFLDLRFESSMLRAHTSAEAVEAARAGELWANLTRPVLANSGQFRVRMSAEDIGIFEAVADSSLQSLGYPLASATPRADAVLSDARTARFEALNRRLKEQFMQDHADSADLKSRAPQEEVMQHIRNRAGSWTGP